MLIPSVQDQKATDENYYNNLLIYSLNNHNFQKLRKQCNWIFIRLLFQYYPSIYPFPLFIAKDYLGDLCATSQQYHRCGVSTLEYVILIGGGRYPPQLHFFELTKSNEPILA